MTPGDCVNHLDHLAPIVDLLGIPILTEDHTLAETMEKYYPHCETVFIDHQAKLLETLATQYDSLFVTGAGYRSRLSPFFQLLYQKEILFWFCSHGNSDKTLEHFKDQHFAFTYGEQMERRLKEEGYLDQLNGYVRTGNLRLSYYQKHQTFYDRLAKEEIFSRFDQKRPTILYAPTWTDFEKNSSMFEVGSTLIDQLPSHYNLIVKMHPWLKHHKPAEVAFINEKYSKKKNITILDSYPLVYPILKRTDIYLGDFSSIGYDFLHFDRPMFFFEPSNRKSERPNSSFLHQCGFVVPKKKYASIFSYIESTIDDQKKLSPLRNKIYHDAFGEEKNFATIRNEVLHTINQESSKNTEIIEANPFI